MCCVTYGPSPRRQDIPNNLASPTDSPLPCTWTEPYFETVPLVALLVADVSAQESILRIGVTVHGGFDWRRKERKRGIVPIAE